MIVAAAGLYLQFHPNSVKVRSLIKFNHFTEFEKDK